MDTTLIQTLSVVFPVSVYLRGLNVIINFIYLNHCFFSFFFIIHSCVLLFYYFFILDFLQVRTSVPCVQAAIVRPCCNFSSYPRGLKKSGFNCTVTLCISLERYVASLQV